MDESMGHILVILMALFFTFGAAMIFAKIKKRRSRE